MARIWNKHKQTNTPLKPKIFVGMSGGVDSSVAAALLQKRGFDVTGVFIKVWQPESARGKHTDIAGEPCKWKEDRLDAMRVAAHLGISFITMDLEDEYKEEVIDYMVREYRAGHTPNPDVMCNKHIKFGAFFCKAMEMGADYVATGHYARVEKMGDSAGEGLTLRRSLRRERSNLEEQARERISGYKLLKGVDENKDQSYFLWALTQKQLQKTLFPVGKFEKPKVREMARSFGLPTAEKKDSQGLCFVGKLDMKEFLKDFIPENRGDVINEEGEVVGSHNGAHFYTLGQRHGFEITAQTAENAPYYVVAKDIEKNAITVSHKKRDGGLPLGKKEMTLRETNWIMEIPREEKLYDARFRYRQKLLQRTLLSISGTIAHARFEEPQIADAGQSLVLYDGPVCIGGGIIV